MPISYLPFEQRKCGWVPRGLVYSVPPFIVFIAKHTGAGFPFTGNSGLKYRHVPHDCSDLNASQYPLPFTSSFVKLAQSPHPLFVGSFWVFSTGLFLGSNSRLKSRSGRAVNRPFNSRIIYQLSGTSTNMPLPSGKENIALPRGAGRRNRSASGKPQHIVHVVPAKLDCVNL